jgi:hypothetical protein
MKLAIYKTTIDKDIKMSMLKMIKFNELIRADRRSRPGKVFQKQRGEHKLPLEEGG